MGKIIFWAAIVYIALVVLWRIFIAIMMIFESYHEAGFLSALAAAGINLIVGIWDFAKFAFTVLILFFLIKTCR